MCRKLKEGDPRRKRFPSLISKFGRFEAITLYLLRDKIRIAINGATEEDIIYFNEKFSTSRDNFMARWVESPYHI